MKFMPAVLAVAALPHAALAQRRHAPGLQSVSFYEATFSTRVFTFPAFSIQTRDRRRPYQRRRRRGVPVIHYPAPRCPS